jgi:microsomal prostaglandin-E synthase 2
MVNYPVVYQYEACPFSWKVKAMLDYKGITYNVVEVNPLSKKEILFSKDYKKVPIFVDESGKQVNDSNVIMRHIERLYPEKEVFETTEEKKDKEDFFLSWSNDVLAKSLPPLIYKTFASSSQAFDYITKVSKFGFFTKFWIKFVGGFVMTLIAKKLKKKIGIENVEEHFKRTLSFLAKEISEGGFLGEGRVNAADLANYGILKSVEDLQAFSFVKSNEQVFAWYQRVHQSIIVSKNESSKEKAAP